MSGIEDLARKGRNGDNTLMHVSTDEVAGLNSLARSMMGRELTQNPETGLPEAFLFTPFLAPAIAGSLGLGGGALATGLTAGALGATEAAVRGMDDPLERGLYSGLTAGAASGIGNALSGAAEAGQAAGQAGQGAGQAGQAATTSAPDLGEAVKGAGSGGFAGTGFSVTNPSISGQPSVPTGDLSIAGMGAGSQAPTTSLVGSSMTQVPGQAGQTMSSVTPPPSASAQFPSGSNFDVTSTTQPPGPLGQYGDIPQMAEGAKNILTDPTGELGRQFMSQAQMPIAAGAAGLGGQAQMRARDEMKERADEAKAEKEADRREAENQIRSSYAAIGRPMPTAIGGDPLFQQGGIVGLRRGKVSTPTSGASATPTPISTMRTKPSQTRNMFLDELQQGAGNRMTMQNNGYRGGMGMAEGGYLDGGMLPGDGMSDDVPASIDGEQPAALSSGEFVIPADVVSHIGNGSSDSGAKELYAMMDRIRKARTGEDDQAPPVNARKMMPK